MLIEQDVFVFQVFSWMRFFRPWRQGADSDIRFVSPLQAFRHGAGAWADDGRRTSFLRGKRVCVSFLRRCFGSSLPEVFFMNGAGEGAWKETVMFHGRLFSFCRRKTGVSSRKSGDEKFFLDECRNSSLFFSLLRSCGTMPLYWRPDGFAVSPYPCSGGRQAKCWWTHRLFLINEDKRKLLGNEVVFVVPWGRERTSLTWGGRQAVLFIKTKGRKRAVTCQCSGPLLIIMRIITGIWFWKFDIRK